MDINTAALNLERARYDVSRFETLRGSGQKDGGFAALLDSAVPAVKKPENQLQIDRSSKLYAQCEELENFFLKTLINGMRKTVEKSELNKTGFAGEFYEDMLWDERAKDFAKNARLGFADLAYLELTGQRGKVLGKPV